MSTKLLCSQNHKAQGKGEGAAWEGGGGGSPVAVFSQFALTLGPQTAGHTVKTSRALKQTGAVSHTDPLRIDLSKKGVRWTHVSDRKIAECTTVQTTPCPISCMTMAQRCRQGGGGSKPVLCAPSVCSFKLYDIREKTGVGKRYTCVQVSVFCTAHVSSVSCIPV